MIFITKEKKLRRNEKYIMKKNKGYKGDGYNINILASEGVQFVLINWHLWMQSSISKLNMRW